MPVSHRFDRKKRRIVSTAYGVLTKDDLLSHRERLRHDPDFDPTFDQLFDFSGVAEVQVAPQTVRNLASGNPFTRTARRAFVANQPLVHSVVRMFIAQMNLPAERVGIFETTAEAISWLER